MIHVQEEKKIKKKCTSKYEYDICARRKISKFQNKKKCTSKYAQCFHLKPTHNNNDLPIGLNSCGIPGRGLTLILIQTTTTPPSPTLRFLNCAIEVICNVVGLTIKSCSRF